MSDSSERPRPMRYNMVQGDSGTSDEGYYKQLCAYMLPRLPMPLSPLKAFRLPFQDLPFDVLPPVLAQLSDSRDWHACALVNKSFCRVATPLLYRTLDSRIISKASHRRHSSPASSDFFFSFQTLVHHPSSTLLQRPQLALYVRHVTETGKCHLVRLQNLI